MGNSQVNYIIERIHQLLDNLISNFELDKNYVNGDYTWRGILAAAAFAVRSTFHTTNKKSTGQILFGWDIIAPIEHVANWRLIYQRKQTLIDKNTDR